MNSLQSFAQEKPYTFQEYLTRVFSIVLLGLGISMAVAYAMANMGGYYLLARVPYPFLAVFAVQIGIAWFFTGRLHVMKKTTAWICYVVYCAFLGVTYSILPFIYDGRSIFFALVMTAVLFATMAIIGHTTRIDLTKYFSYFAIGLWMIILITLINTFFIRSSAMDLIASYAGVLLFLGITAYDVQRLREMYLEGYNNNLMYDKLMLFGAFQLYLDFINLFIRILSIFGRRRD